jgi:hypothetical protein
MHSTATLQRDTQSRWLTTSRGRAFLFHLLASALLAAAAATVVLLAWYPYPYRAVTGGLNTAWIQLGVFLAAGPLLTLILFKPGKRGLALDLVVVALLQLAALVHGLAVLYRDRPHFAVFAVDRFFVLSERDVAPEQLTAARAAGRIDERFMRGPALVVATVPTDEAERQRLLTETLFEGKPDIERRPERWHRFADEGARVVARQRPLSALRAARPESSDAAASAAASLGVPEDRLGFLPLVVGDRHLTVIVDASTGVPVAFIDVDPWIGD